MKQHLSEFDHPAVVDVTEVTAVASAAVIPFGKKAILLPKVAPDWSRRLLKSIAELGMLDQGWDSYGGRPVDPECAAVAVEFLLRVLDRNSPQPSVAPTNRGGIQLEWHRDGAELEIEVEAPRRWRVFFADMQSSEETEFTLTDDLQPLMPLLERVFA